MGLHFPIKWVVILYYIVISGGCYYDDVIFNGCVPQQVCSLIQYDINF